MDENTPSKSNMMATGTASLIAGGAFKLLAPFVFVVGAWMTANWSVQFPDGYAQDLKEWLLVAIPTAVAYWHTRGE